MAKQTLSYEEVDRIVERADLRQFRIGGRGHFNARAVSINPGDVLTKLCGLWKIVGPIVKLIAKSLIFKPKWREALQAWANLMDTVCSNA